MDEEYQRILEASFVLNSVSHKHCFSCYSLTCSNKNIDSCDLIKCSNKCGSRFHSCKLKEHNEMCPNVTVPCINQSLGCPVEILRKDISAHLVKCPASIVVSNYALFVL